MNNNLSLDTNTPGDDNFTTIDLKSRDEEGQYSNLQQQHTIKRYNSCFHSFRYVLISLFGISIGLMFLNRLNMAVSILCMVNHTELLNLERDKILLNHPNESDYSINALKELDELRKHADSDGEFVWSNEIQLSIITSYMIAYTAPQIVATALALKLGPQLSVFIGILMIALSSAFTPMFAYFGWAWVVFLRCINGIGASPLLPLSLHLIEQWMPENEKSTGLLITQFSANVLGILTPLLTGFVTSIHWIWSFYLPAFVTVVYGLIWLFLTRDNIELNPFISQKEVDYILESKKKKEQIETIEKNNLQAISKFDNNFDSESLNYSYKLDTATNNSNNYQFEDRLKQNDSKNNKLQLTTTTNSNNNSDRAYVFRYIFKQAIIYCFLICWISCCACASILAFLAPNYLRVSLNISVDENGFYNFLIQVGTIGSMIYPHYINLFLQKKFSLSTTSARKATFTALNILSAVPLLYLSIMHRYQVLMLAISRALMASNDALILSTVMSKFAATETSSIIFSTMNTFGCATIFFFCWLCGIYLDAHGESLETWSTLLLINVGLCLSNATIYFFFLDSEPLLVPQKAASKLGDASTTIEPSVIAATLRRNRISLARKLSRSSSLASSLDVQTLSK